MMKGLIVPDEVIDKIENWLKSIELYGDYVSYLTVRDVRKIGRRHLHWCPKQKRPVTLLSDGEYRAYQMLIWSPSTIEIKEQMPLDINTTLKIAAEKSIIHPRNWKTSEAYVMTSDFLVTEMDFKTGETKQILYSFKYWDQLFACDKNGRVRRINPRTWQKLKLERIYWKHQKVGFRIITERKATKTKCWNLDWFMTEHDLATSEMELLDFNGAFVDSWLNEPLINIEDHLSVVASQNGHSKQHAQSLFKYSSLNKLLPVDISEPLRLYTPVRLLAA